MPSHVAVTVAVFGVVRETRLAVKMPWSFVLPLTVSLPLCWNTLRSVVIFTDLPTKGAPSRSTAWTVIAEVLVPFGAILVGSAVSHTMAPARLSRANCTVSPPTVPDFD